MAKAREAKMVPQVPTNTKKLQLPKLSQSNQSNRKMKNVELSQNVSLPSLTRNESKRLRTEKQLSEKFAASVHIGDFTRSQSFTSLGDRKWSIYYFWCHYDAKWPEKSLSTTLDNHLSNSHESVQNERKMTPRDQMGPWQRSMQESFETIQMTYKYRTCFQS